jgi:hypothetical protein
MTLSKGYQELNNPYTEGAVLRSEGRIPSSSQIIELLLNSIYLIFPWRGMSSDEGRPSVRRFQRAQKSEEE